MDIPNRLPPPEKRKDKISKNDMRYLYNIQKTKNKAVKRAKIDDEITAEKYQSDKRARTSTAEVKKFQRQVKFNVTQTITKKPKKKLTPEMQLLETAQKVIEGNCHIPCILSKLSAAAAEPLSEQQQCALTEEQILKLDAGAIIWNEWDYPHMITHPRVWVFCASCHLGMPSTQVTKFVASHMKHVIEKSDIYYNCGPIFRWTVHHSDDCTATTNKNIASHGGSVVDAAEDDTPPQNIPL